MDQKTKVGLVQMNNSFANQTYFPYSVGLLQAYFQKHSEAEKEFEFLQPIYKKIPIKDSLENLLDSDISFFSTYLWNINTSLEIAKNIKNMKPEQVIVFGGGGFSKKHPEKFLKENSFIDIACRGEGERVFTSILENYKDRNWKNIPSIDYNEKGKIITNPQGKRIVDLKEVPSPYLEGVFDPLIQSNPEQIWLGLWETNRGCPFSCSYCEWGEEYHNKVSNYDLEKLSKEIDWFSENKVEFIFCCDANFGMMKRDSEIVEKFIENKKKYNYPQRLSVQNTKNSTERSYLVNKMLAESDLSKGVNLAFQSLNKKTLESIGRKNISNDVFQELQQRFNREGIPTFSDIILGLPEETYESFVEGISSLIEGGQKNRIQLINLSILPNSEMAKPEYQKKYGLKTVEAKAINNHGSLMDNEEVYENQELVIGTNTMPSEDWVKTRTFSWMTSLLYFDKLLQIPFNILNKEYSMGHRTLTEGFFKQDDKNAPIISNIYSLFENKAREIQEGGSEFCQSKEHLGIWWPVDELAFINLVSENKLNGFYKESQDILEDLLNQKNISYDTNVLKESLSLNKNLIKTPFKNSDLKVKTTHNILEVYEADLTGKMINLEDKSSTYHIDRTNEKWGSWDDWCKEVVWYQNKKGAYLYPYNPIKK
jgi:radical SAM superfamily enzyme YgiQ (UPF0313 family)